MLTENDVVGIMSAFLKKRGFTIVQSRSTTQKGIDVVAKSTSGVFCYIEAKGATSSNRNSKRFGQLFSRSQVYDHISKAITKSLQTIQENSRKNAMVGIALPKDKNHIEIVDSVKKPLRRIGVRVYFVDESEHVEEYI